MAFIRGQWREILEEGEEGRGVFELYIMMGSLFSDKKKKLEGDVEERCSKSLKNKWKSPQKTENFALCSNKSTRGWGNRAS